MCSAFSDLVIIMASLIARNGCTSYGCKASHDSTTVTTLLFQILKINVRFYNSSHVHMLNLISSDDLSHKQDPINQEQDEQKNM